MTIETATYTPQLDATYPASGDAKSEGDNHIRLLKSTIKATWPNLTATAVTPTSADLNTLAGAATTGGVGLNVATQASTDNSTKAASTAFVSTAVAAAAFASTLPSQSGNGGKSIYTDGITASWQSLGGPVTVVSGTTQTAVAGNHYVLTNVAATAVTLPASPTTSDVIWFTVGNNLTTNTIDPGANTINGVAGVLTVDDPYATIFFKWDGSTWLLIPLGGYTPSFARPAITGPATVTANSASAALTVTQTGAGNAFVVEDSASTDSTPFVITATGSTVVGAAASFAGIFGNAANLQVASVSTHPIHLSRFANDAFGTDVQLLKSRNTTPGGHTIVQSGDSISSIFFGGSDGTNYIPAASILGQVDGTPGTNDMPGRLVFSTTADGGSSPAERLRIDNAGVITARIGTAIPAGGTAGFGYCATSTANFGVFFGSGAPTLSAAKGSLYLRSDGSTTNDRMYVNTNGATTWTAVTTAA